ncbi:MAG: hypothetical protein IKL82_04020 [Clostridia bacterium]|nr:hypothetical protein [Clostridia bacterium]
MKPSESIKVVKPKLKKELVITLIVSLIAILVIFLSSFGFSYETTKGEDYASQLESKVEKLLSSIEGVGKVEVFITVDGSSEEVLAKTVETKIENGVKITTESLILISGKPYVTKVLSPKIIGVTIVCKGANKVAVKVAITECVKSALQIDAERIKILKMK